MMASRTTVASKPATDLVPILENDLPGIARFIAQESGREPGQVEKHLRWFLLENPARGPEMPLGFALRAGKEAFVGCLLCVPQMFRYGQQRFCVMGSSCFYVNESHRGSGALIFLKYSRLTERWPLFGNSANAEAANLWKSRGAVAIPNSDRELIGVLQWSPVMEDVIHKKAGRPAMPRLTGTLASGMVSPFRRLKLNRGDLECLQPLTSAKQAAEVCSTHAPDALTSVRDIAYLSWRYFSGNDATVAVFAFRNVLLEKPVFVAVNQRPRGYRGQIHALYVLDLYPAIEAGVLLEIVGALSALYRGKADMIVLRCLNPDQQEAAQRAGFIERKFDAHNGWFLDKKNLLPSDDWYTVPADGDWVI